MRYLVFAGLLAALTAGGALTAVSLPFLSPVPFTLQVLAVFLTAGLLPPRYAMLSQAVYLLVGALGVPVFAGGQHGLGVLVGPFAGYLWAYPVAAGLGSVVAHRRRRGALAGGLIVALLIVYAGGFLGLMVGAGMSPLKAFLAGVLPFIGWDAIKGVIAYPIITQLTALVGEPHRLGRAA